MTSKKDGKGTCERNKHDISLISENTNFHDQQRVAFFMMLSQPIAVRVSYRLRSLRQSNCISLVWFFLNISKLKCICFLYFTQLDSSQDWVLYAWKFKLLRHRHSGPKMDRRSNDLPLSGRRSRYKITTKEENNCVLELLMKQKNGTN